jgi:hypothetical protein
MGLGGPKSWSKHYAEEKNLPGQFSSSQFSHFTDRAVLETFCPKCILPLLNQPPSKQAETLSGKIKSFLALSEGRVIKYPVTSTLPVHMSA